MKREEAIKWIEKLRTQYATAAETGPTREYRLLFKEAADVLDAALAALRAPTREQVEKVWKGEWKIITAHNGCTPDQDCVCSKCGASGTPIMAFCDACGAPMTDEAVDILMKRLEALKDGSTD